MFGKLAYFKVKLRYVRILNNQIQRVSQNSFVQFGYDVSAFALAESQAFCSFAL